MHLPDYTYSSISKIPVQGLRAAGIRGLILDIDNTLTTHNHPHPSDGVQHWLREAEDAGMSMIVLSNNKARRVAPFAEILELPFVANGKKPLTSGYRRCAELMNCTPKETVIIGDQLFTDIWGGARFGCMTILVEPIEKESMIFFKIKRFFEGRILKGQEKREL